MPEIVNERMEEYSAAHTTGPGALFDQLAAETRSKTKASGMMSGPVVGQFLATLVAATRAKRVLEIGTFTGYSALMMASALPDDGQVICCDVSEEYTSIARRYWAKSPHSKKIELRLGPALKTLDTLKGPFDVVFIDADKPNYPAYYEKALPLLSDHGMIVADNVLWGGRIEEPEGESGKALAAFNDLVQADPRVTNVLLTVRDGLMVIRKNRP